MTEVGKEVLNSENIQLKSIADEIFIFESQLNLFEGNELNQLM